MLRAGVIGASGCAGEELLRILVRHPRVKIQTLAAKMDESCPISRIFPWTEKLIDLECRNDIDVDRIVTECDVVFLALPHRVSMLVAPEFIKAGKRVIDFSADYRLKDVAEYEKWYEVAHKSPELIKDSVYGLCELYRDKIRNAQLLANPGCYPTGIILGSVPFLKSGRVEPEVIADAKSGTTGAGRTLSIKLMFSEVNENFRAYKVNEHQHMPEMIQQLREFSPQGLTFTFVPHLVPMSRGILSTLYMRLKQDMSVFDAVDILKEFYRDEPFIRIKPADEFPEIRDVVNSNFCDLGVKVAGRQLIVIAAIDNLVKGAAGQAVQNLNIMFDMDETLGFYEQQSKAD